MVTIANFYNIQSSMSCAKNFKWTILKDGTILLMQILLQMRKLSPREINVCPVSDS